MSQEESFGSDGWCSADVSPDNTSSMAVCKSLNGKRTWHLDWYAHPEIGQVVQKLMRYRLDRVMLRV